jgi:transcriptional regulator with XRE-family HTH domain
VTRATLDIVPPQRLGMLLAGARAERGLTLADVASRTAFDEDRLASIEAGLTPLTEESLTIVMAGYGTTIDELLPTRRQVVLDLDAGRLLVAEEAVPLQGVPTPDEVLGAYLSLVYTLRRATPGSPVVLRGFDVAVLAKALDLAEPDVEARLRGLMIEPTAEVSRLTKLFRSKLVLPIAGAVVVATALGTVLVLRNDTRPAPAPTGVQRSGEVPPPEVGPAANQQRNDDGSVGPVQELSP